MDEWNEKDYFNETSGSRCDTKFKCILCGYTFEQQFNGVQFNRGAGELSPHEWANKAMMEHLRQFHMKKIMGE